MPLQWALDVHVDPEPLAVHDLALHMGCNIDFLWSFQVSVERTKGNLCCIPVRRMGRG